MENSEENLKQGTLTIPTEFQTSYLKSLDGLRGVAIIIVILSHCSKVTGWNPIDAVDGVEIFFVISGFLITTLLIKEKIKNDVISLKRFYLRRFIRIFPVAYLFVFVLFLLNLYFKLGISVTSFLTSLFYLKNLPIPNGEEWYSGHFWSLSVEEQFYLIFPFLLSFSINKYTSFIVLFILFITILGYLAEHRVGVFYTNKIIHVVTFVLNSVLFGRGTVSILIGSLSSILVYKKIIIINKLPNSYFLTAVLFVAGVFIRDERSVIYVPTLSKFLFSIIIAFLILINLQEKENFFSFILNTRILKQIGILSYSLYIWQQLFTYNQPWKNVYPPYSNSIYLNIPLLFVVAMMSYNLYEKRFLLLKNKFK